MLKVLRKYNKIILAVFGTMLMVAFLMPQAIQQLGKARMSRAVATMDGHKVTATQMDEAVRELTALRDFFDKLGRQLPLPLDKDNKTDHWLLLSREAQQEGLVGGADEGATLMPIFAQALVEGYYAQQYQQQFGSQARQIAQYAMAQQPDEVKKLTAQAMDVLARSRASAAGSARMSGEQFDAALARLQGVTRLLNEYRSAERISDTQTIEIAKKLADSALVDGVFLSGRDLADESLVPTPQELQTFFERFRSFKQGEGEFGIGYKLPPRVKVEWIAIDRPTIEAAITIALPDAIKYFKQNTERFPGEFDSQRSAVEAELRKAKVDSVVSTAESVIRAEIALAIRPLEKKSDYRIVPADWDQIKPDLLKIADMIPSAVQAADGVAIPKPPVYIRANSWLDEQRLRALPGIGNAQVRIGQTRGTFAQFVLSVRELAGDSILNLQVGIPNITSPAVDEKGNEYFFTVLAAVPSEIASEYTQVLDQDRLLSNWRAMQRYEQLVAKLPEYLELAQNEGLDALAASFGTIDDDKNKPDEDAGTDKDTTEPQSETPEPEPLARVTVIHNASVFENRTNGLMRVENNAAVIDAVRHRASKIDPLTPIEDISLADRMVSVAVPVRLGVLISQINGVQPLTREQLPRHADSAVLYRQNQTMESRALPYPYQFEALRVRHGFESLRSKDDEDQTPAATPAQDAAPAAPEEQTAPKSDTGS